MNSSLIKHSLTAAVAIVFSTEAYAANIAGYQFDGLSRVPTDTVMVVLPPVGSAIDSNTLADGIHALYATGQFSNVQAHQVNGMIMYQVVERPIIAEVNFNGNKLIPKQGLEEGLKQAGLAAGMILKQATVHGVATELKNQYQNQGYYNSDIEVIQTPLDANRVKLDINFIEGKAAKVIDINILGNHHLSDEDIKSVLLLKEKNWNFLSKSSHFSEERFAASLEALKAKYLNEGFARFNIESATLNINEEKDSIFIEIDIHEGERYQFGQTRFLGNLIYESGDLAKKITYQVGGQYSQNKLDETSQALAARFGDDGYYNAQVRPVSVIDDATRTVNIDYYINPMRPVYVRRINFSGNIKTKDEVLRREMRQLENALASNTNIQLSKIRLMRTGYFKDVKVQTRPVPNSPDLMDIDFVVEEQPSGSSTLAAGYSQGGGVTFQADLSQNNFMGTGNKMNAAFSRSASRESYNLGYTDPYFTENGISQSLGLYYRKTKIDPKRISNYALNSFGGNISYGYPIDEKQRVSIGLNADKTEINGGRNMALSSAVQLIDDGGTIDLSNGIPSFYNKYTGYKATLGWTYSSLDKPVFPTNGASHDVDLTLGFGDRTYQKLSYQGNYYYPLIKGAILRGYTKLGYGNNLPFYENFYAGGYGSVRGYKASTLGPKSPSVQGYSENVGGNVLATFGTELILPMPFKGDWSDQVRPVVFAEGGQVFDTTNNSTKVVNLKDYGGADKTVPLSTKDNDLRYAVGAGATWYTPIGPLSLSYSKPLGSKEGDSTDKLQFQIGSVF